MQATAITESSRLRRAAGPTLLGTLLVIVAAVSWTTLRNESLTFDEVTYIPAGYSYVVTGDYRLNPEHPPLTKLLAGMALLPLEPRLDTTQTAWQTADQWAFGRAFFEQSGIPAQRLVSVARLPTVLMTMLLVVAAYALANALYGRAAGVTAAFFCAFSPNILAHGRLATNDLALAFTVLLTALATFRFTRRPSLVSGLLAGGALGLALLTKYNAVLLVGLVPLWLVLTALPEGRMPVPGWRWLPQGVHPRFRRILFAAGASAPILLVALLVVTLAYGAPGDPRPYLRGLSVLYTNVRLDMPAYFHGTFHAGRLPYYFLGVFLLKTPTPFLLLLGLRAGDQVMRRELDRDSAIFLALPALLWFVVVSATAMPFGVRYILPIYPLAFVYVSGLVASPSLAATWRKACVAALAGLMAISSVRAYPHYLPYFNLLAGGPDNGIEWLDDSNVDWGQDLPLLREYVETHDVRDLTIAPMGWYDPALYGVHGRVVGPDEMMRLLADPNAPPGFYAASAHLLTRGRYTSSSFDVLSSLTPVAVLGHSIYVYEVYER